MSGIIIDIAERSGERWADLRKYPSGILIDIWKDLQYPEWIKRGQDKSKSDEAPKEEYKRIMSVWS